MVNAGDADGSVPLSDSLKARRAREVWKSEMVGGHLGKMARVARRRMRYDIARLDRAIEE